jgi:hypothetical protein
VAEWLELLVPELQALTAGDLKSGGRGAAPLSGLEKMWGISGKFRVKLTTKP